MDISTVPTVISITIIAYIVGEIVKNIEAIDDKWIPVIVSVTGGILGVAGMHVIPEFPAQDWLTAIAVGAMSGLASTGIHQVIKQLFVKSE